MCANAKEERLAVFKNMAAADPENELAHFSLGKAYLEFDDRAEAEKSFRRTLALNPRHALAHRFLGEILLLSGTKDEAVKVLSSGVLLAHEKGEWKPRNEMQDLLRQAGVEPPSLPGTGAAGAGAAGAGASGGPAAAATGAFTCRRCGQPNPRLEEPPFKNELGREVLEKICRQCWREWIVMSIKVINEYRLNLMMPEAQEVYDKHLREFLGLS